MTDAGDQRKRRTKRGDSTASDVDAQRPLCRRQGRFHQFDPQLVEPHEDAGGQDHARGRGGGRGVRESKRREAAGAYLHSGVTARGRRVFHFSTMRFSSAIGASLSSTCRRSTVSLCSQTPQFFLTMTSAADC